MINNIIKNYKLIAIVGSTKRQEKQKIKELLLEKRKYFSIIAVSGGAKGIDNDCEFVCKQLGIPYLIFPPKYNKYDKKGNDIYFERNYKIAEIAEEMYAFPLGYKDGTNNTIKYFKELGKKNNLSIF